MLRNLLRPLIIFGTGSMGRVLHSFLEQRSGVFAFCADDGMVHNDRLCNKPIIKLSHLLSMEDPEYRIVMAIGYHGMNSTRAARYEDFKQRGFHMVGYTHHTIVQHEDVHLANACVIYDNVAIHPGSRVHENAFISSNVSIGHDCNIGAHAWINSGVTLAGGVQVGERCVLSINSCVAQNVTLGVGTFVGAGAVVTEDTPENSVVIANSSIPLNMDSTRFTALVKQP